MKKIFWMAITFLFSFALNAQQIGMYSHYFYKPMVYNPAFTGIAEATNIMVISRSQWTDFKGSPQLNIVTADGDLMNKKVGLGVMLVSDRKGITSRIGGDVSYSYRLNINDDMHLLFGVSLGIVDQTIDYSKALVESSNDPTLFSDSERKTVFNGNAGLAFVWKGLEFAAAVPQIIGNKIKYVDDSNVRGHYTHARHYMGSLKYKFFIFKEKGLSIAPQGLVRFVPNTPFQYDGNINLDWQSKFWIGATYKSDYAVGANVGFYIHKQLCAGYSYDFIIGNIGKYSGMSHEIMINFKFGKNKKEELVVEQPIEDNDLENAAYVKRMDSLQMQLKDSQDKLKELSAKLDQINKTQVQVKSDTKNEVPIQNPQIENSTFEKRIDDLQKNVKGSPEKLMGLTVKLDQPINQAEVQTPTKNVSHVQNQNALPNNENQNKEMGQKSANKKYENGVLIVTAQTNEFKDVNDQTPPPQGFYVVVGTYFYRDFAIAETQHFVKRGYTTTGWVYSGPLNFNYIFMYKLKTLEEAQEKIKIANEAGVKDAWIQELIDK